MSTSSPPRRSSSTTTIVVLVGNPRPQSRTRAAAEQLANALVVETPSLAGSTVATIDLAELGSTLLDKHSPAVEEAATRVTEATVLVVATPVFKGAYTGILKVFLDRLPGGALSDVCTIPVTVAGAAAHQRAADRALRPVLAELEAAVVPRSFFLQESDLPTVVEHAHSWSKAHASTIAPASTPV